MCFFAQSARTKQLLDLPVMKWIIFDCDSTLISMEGIDELAKRLHTIRPNQKDLDAIADKALLYITWDTNRVGNAFKWLG